MSSSVNAVWKKGGSEKEEAGERGNGNFSTPCQRNLGKTTEREEDSLARGFRVSANHGGEGVAKPVMVARELRKSLLPAGGGEA